MSSLNSPIAKTYTKFVARLALTMKVALFLAVSFMHVSVRAWEVDLSRRQGDLQKVKTRGPASVVTENQKKDSMFAGIFTSLDPAQEIVIMNTEKGFVPETIQLKAGQAYKIHVVNVNEAAKNVSFVFDAFSEHHGTFYGQPKTFQISPKIEGVFSFQCPETAKQGRVVVAPNAEGRRPASE